jgi:hypothetical protein
MTIFEAQKIAAEWLKNNDVAEGTSSYDMQFRELVKIIWLNKKRKLI